MPEVFETNLGLGVGGATEDSVVDPIRDNILLTTGIDLDPLTSSPGSASGRVAAGDINFAWGLPGLLDGSVPGLRLLFGLPFGFEPAEYASWYYEGGGRDLMKSLLATAGVDIEPFLAGLRAGESGGWFKEAITLKMLQEGVYSDGSPIRMRFFGLAGAIMTRAFPNITTPPGTVAVTPLNDFKSGNFNALEFGAPTDDVSPNLPSAGLFPNWPARDGSIIEAGARHYYVGGWWQPLIPQELWVNKTYFDALSADDQNRIALSAKGAALEGLQRSYGKNEPAALTSDEYIKQWQDWGVQIHQEWPEDVLEELRAATVEVINDQIAGDGGGTYVQIYDSMRLHAKANARRWARTSTDRTNRFNRWAGWAPDVAI